MIEIIIGAIAAGLASAIGAGVYSDIKETKIREGIRKKMGSLSRLEKKAALSLSNSELGRLVKEKAAGIDIPMSNGELGKIVREELEK